MRTAIWSVAVVIAISCMLTAGCGDNGGSTDGGNGSDTPPEIESVTPDDESENVAVTTKVWVEFSKAMEATPTEEAFSLEADGTPVAGTFTWADENMVFSPDEELSQATEFTVTIGTGAADTYGNSLEETFTSTFMTGSNVGVLSVTPDDGATDVAIDTNIVVSFAQAMDEASVEGEFILESDAGAVTGVFSWADDSLTFDSDADLLNVEAYIVTIGRGAMDAEGSHLPVVFSANFTTVATPPEVTGDIISDTPTWTWSAPVDCTGFRYQLDGEDGDWTEVDATVTSYTVETPLPDGDHTLYVQAGYKDTDWSSSGSWTTEAAPVCVGNLVINSAADLTGVTCAVVAGNLEVWGTALTDLAGLESIKVVQGNVDLQYNTALASLHGLEGLIEINGNLAAWGNNVLTTMDGLVNLERIDGSLALNEAYFSSLTGLGKLEVIGGNLTVGRGSTTGLGGLDSLTTIGGDVYIGRIANMGDFTGLEQVETIGGMLHVFRSNLTSFAGLTSLVSIGGDLKIEESDVHSFAGLDSLQTIGGNLNFADAYATPDLSGLGSLTTIGGSLLIVYSTAPGSLAGLDSLTSIGGDVEIRLAGSLTAFGSPNLESIGGFLSVQDSHSLLNFDGLSGLISIGGDLTVRATMGVQTVSGMTSLETLTGNLAIQGNMTLPTCDAVKLQDQLRGHGWEGTSDIAGNNDAGTCD